MAERKILFVSHETRVLGLPQPYQSSKRGGIDIFKKREDWVSINVFSPHNFLDSRVGPANRLAYFSIGDSL